jgi:beta-galactosidase GanA
MNEKYIWLILPIIALLAVPAIADNVSVSATVPTYVSVVFNYNTVNYGQVSATGVTDLEAPNGASGVYNVTVNTNVPLNVSAYRTAFTPSDVLTLKIATATSTSDLSTATKYTLTTTPQLIATNLPTGSYTHYHDYFLTVPSLTSPGTYSTTVTITYSS